MSKSINRPPVWKKPKSKVYDYNYNLGEHYYKPQLRHLENKYANKQRESSPPRARTFAERFAADPVYGSTGLNSYRSSQDNLFDSTSQSARRTSLQEEFSSGLASRRQQQQQSLFESAGGLTRDEEHDEFRSTLGSSRQRLNFGDRLLEAVGGLNLRRQNSNIADNNFGSGLSAEDPFADPFFQRKPRTADPDFMSEDPFLKLRRNNEQEEGMFSRRTNAASSTSKALTAVNTDMDDDEDYLGNFKKDTESVVAGFRSRMKARKQRDEEEIDAPAESRVDKIRLRAKARLAELEDDLPALSLNSSSRGRDLLRNMADDFDSSLSSNVGVSKTLKLTKRTIKTTIETD